MREHFIDETRLNLCRKFFIEFGGRNHLLIQQAMRDAGYKTFNSRCLYRNSGRPGYIERFGWRDLPEVPKRPISKRKQRRMISTGPVDPASFQAWLKKISPGYTWDWRYQQLVYRKLTAITEGKCKRLMIFMPPRHGKSELVTVRYSAWRLQKDPSLNIILASYNQKLANRFSRKVKQALRDATEVALKESGVTVEASSDANETETREANSAGKCTCSNASNDRKTTDNSGSFGDAPLPRRTNTAEEWETTKGGGVRAVGVGAGVTGFGAGMIIIDDPVKSRAEAESATHRERVWDWFNDDLYTRLEPDAPMILIQTRWHEDDLAGRLIREMENGGEQWDILSLPALSEPPVVTGGYALSPSATENIPQAGTRTPPAHAGGSAPVPHSMDPLGRAPGEALCPERFNREALLRIKTQLGSYSFSALYQQRPTPVEGGLFKRKWFKVIEKPPTNLRWKRGYDLAVSTKTTADYTASFRCAYDNSGNLYIADGFRKRIEFPEQRKYILERMSQENFTEHGIESALHGQAFVQELRREPAYRRNAFRAIQVSSDKFTRALSWANLAEEGKVHLVRGPWIDAFIEEACSFPTGKHDDQIDAVSLAVNMLSQKKYLSYGF